MSSADLRDDALQPSLAEIGFVWFFRVIALYCLLFGISYWMRLIGYYDGWQFDLMPHYWQIASASLAVLYPIAGIGLWMTASWGPVMWCVCAAAEAIMFLGFSEYFGSSPAVLITHLLVATGYAGFRIMIMLQRRRAA